jgi:hypothetical protein
MKLVTAPQYHFPDSKPTLFLAGGISNCHDWQSEMIELLRDTELTVFNPRRPAFVMNNKKYAEQQIQWEFDHLQKVDAISFWFAEETVCPIVLYELGFQLGMCQKEIKVYDVTLAENKMLFVGCHPNYTRTHDVEVQSRLVLGPHFPIASSIQELAKQIKKSLR